MILRILTACLLLTSCAAPLSTRSDEWNNLYRVFQMIDAPEVDRYKTDVCVTVIIDKSMQPNIGGLYMSPNNTIILRGKWVGGKIIVSDAAAGHEFRHALSDQSDGVFVNPDEEKP